MKFITKIMNKYYKISKEDWDKTLLNLFSKYDIYAPVEYGENQDYELISEDLISEIIYNRPKPATPLKTFFQPVIENVTSYKAPEKTRIVMGVPACDQIGRASCRERVCHRV